LQVVLEMTRWSSNWRADRLLECVACDASRAMRGEMRKRNQSIIERVGSISARDSGLVPVSFSKFAVGDGAAYRTGHHERLGIDHAAMNPTQFNAEDGSGYEFVAKIVLDLDAKNPQVAARLLSVFKSWRTMEPKRRALAKAALRHVAGAAGLSLDVKDIAERSLA
jgi:hypothetical protein